MTEFDDTGSPVELAAWQMARWIRLHAVHVGHSLSFSDMLKCDHRQATVEHIRKWRGLDRAA